MTTRIHLTKSNFINNNLSVVPFKTPNDIPVVRVNRTYMDNPSFLPSRRIELNDIEDDKVSYLFGKWELVGSNKVGMPDLFEQKLLYVLLSIYQTFHSSGENNHSFRFKSRYALLRLLGYDRENSSGIKIRKRLEKSLSILTSTGFYCEDYYNPATKTKKGNKIHISGMLSAWEYSNGFGLRIVLNEEFVHWMSKIFTHRIELLPVLSIQSGQALRMFEILVKQELTFKQKGWWEIYLDNLVAKVGIRGKFKYPSEKIRYLEKAFDAALPALSSNLTKFSDAIQMHIGKESEKAPYKVVFYRSSKQEEATCELAL